MPPEVGRVTCYLESQAGAEGGPWESCGDSLPRHTRLLLAPAPSQPPFSVGRVFKFSENRCCALCSLCFLSPLTAGHLGKAAGPA